METRKYKYVKYREGDYAHLQKLLAELQSGTLKNLKMNQTLLETLEWRVKHKNLYNEVK